MQFALNRISTHHLWIASPVLYPLLHLTNVFIVYYLPEGEYWKYSMGQKNGVDAFGYNSAESEPIWMKSRVS